MKKKDKIEVIFNLILIATIVSIVIIQQKNYLDSSLTNTVKEVIGLIKEFV